MLSHGQRNMDVETFREMRNCQSYQSRRHPLSHQQDNGSGILQTNPIQHDGWRPKLFQFSKIPDARIPEAK